MKYNSLSELEDAQGRESTRERKRVDLGDEYLGYYRSRMRQMLETFYDFGAREGIADDPTFRRELHRASDIADESARRANQMLIELDEDYRRLGLRHSEERENYIASQRIE